eukprot:TRINITY_DN9984_c0_g1_i1.p1 TRINITY_DN9984_c0_g1~~TRINITY_DN9984_c0_g1_i1.p1  ORF type:complete len:814 (+),score=39.25 TRINITY_DN9984_c0_g1_i1:125-2443(+)
MQTHVQVQSEPKANKGLLSAGTEIQADRKSALVKEPTNASITKVRPIPPSEECRVYCRPRQTSSLIRKRPSGGVVASNAPRALPQVCATNGASPCADHKTVVRRAVACIKRLVLEQPVKLPDDLVDGASDDDDYVTNVEVVGSLRIETPQIPEESPMPPSPPPPLHPLAGASINPVITDRRRGLSKSAWRWTRSVNPVSPGQVERSGRHELDGAPDSSVGVSLSRMQHHQERLRICVGKGTGTDPGETGDPIRAPEEGSELTPTSLRIGLSQAILVKGAHRGPCWSNVAATEVPLDAPGYRRYHPQSGEPGHEETPVSTEGMTSNVMSTVVFTDHAATSSGSDSMPRSREQSAGLSAVSTAATVVSHSVLAQASLGPCAVRGGSLRLLGPRGADAALLSQGVPAAGSSTQLAPSSPADTVGPLPDQSTRTSIKKALSDGAGESNDALRDELTAAFGQSGINSLLAEARGSATAMGTPPAAAPAPSDTLRRKHHSIPRGRVNPERAYQRPPRSPLSAAAPLAFASNGSPVYARVRQWVKSVPFHQSRSANCSTWGKARDSSSVSVPREFSCGHRQHTASPSITRPLRGAFTPVVPALQRGPSRAVVEDASHETLRPLVSPSSRASSATPAATASVVPSQCRDMPPPLSGVSVPRLGASDQASSHQASFHQASSSVLRVMAKEPSRDGQAHAGDETAQQELLRQRYSQGSHISIIDRLRVMRVTELSRMLKSNAPSASAEILSSLEPLLTHPLESSPAVASVPRPAPVWSHPRG